MCCPKGSQAIVLLSVVFVSMLVSLIVVANGQEGKVVGYTTTAPPSEHKGYASLVFMYTGDAPVTMFFQETMRLKKAMTNYDKVVLLKHNELPAGIDLSEADEKLADIKDLPTKANIKKYLGELTKAGYTIDVWIVGHGKDGGFTVSEGTYASKETMTADEISKLAKENGYSKLRIRMVWSTLCYGRSLNDAWRSAGAMVVSGSQYVCFYPTQFGRFSEEWADGVPYQNAVEISDTETTRTTVQIYLAYLHAPSCNKDWGSCPVGKTILGDHECAKDYFSKKWGLSGEEWKPTSGKGNMNYSSKKHFKGDLNVTKSTKWREV